MSRVCVHCGETFEEQGRLVCPHCGADVDQPWSEAPIEADYEGVGFAEGDEGYEEFLEREGLAPGPSRGRKRPGCAVLLAVPGLLVLLLL